MSPARRRTHRPPHPAITARYACLLAVSLALLLFGGTAIASPALSGTALAPADATLTFSAVRIGGEPSRIVVSGTLGFVAYTHMVRTLDLSVPLSPTQVGRTLDLPNVVTALAPHGRWLYAATSTALYVLDTTNPYDLRIHSAFSTTSPAHALAAHGAYLYLGDDGRGVLTLDATNPDDLHITGIIPITRPVNAIAISGTLAFAAADRVYALDLTDPSLPVVLDSAPIGSTVRDLTIHGDYVYAVHDYPNVVNLAVLDARDPTDLRLGRRINLTGSAYSVFADPQAPRLLVTTLPSDNRTTLYAVSIASPTLPVTTAVLTGLGRGTYGALTGSALLLADPGGGRVHSVDVRNPTQLRALTGWGAPARARALALDGPRAFVADTENGLRVLDTQDPFHPLREIGAAPLPDVTQAVVYSASYAYVTASFTGLHIFDVHDPTQPREVGTYDTPGAALGLANAAARVYIADGLSGLLILDTHVLTNPVPLATFATAETAYAVTIGPRPDQPGTLAYLASTGWVRILDVTTPSAPRVLATYATGGINRALAVQGTTLYVANSAFGLSLFDVSDPTALVPLSYYPAVGAVSVAIADRFALVGADAAGLYALDISDPLSPTLITHYPSADAAHGVALQDGFAWLADSRGGVIRGILHTAVAWLRLPYITR